MNKRSAAILLQEESNTVWLYAVGGLEAERKRRAGLIGNIFGGYHHNYALALTSPLHSFIIPPSKAPGYASRDTDLVCSRGLDTRPGDSLLIIGHTSFDANGI